MGAKCHLGEGRLCLPGPRGPLSKLRPHCEPGTGVGSWHTVGKTDEALPHLEPTIPAGGVGDTCAKVIWDTGDREDETGRGRHFRGSLNGRERGRLPERKGGQRRPRGRSRGPDEETNVVCSGNVRKAGRAVWSSRKAWRESRGRAPRAV